MSKVTSSGLFLRSFRVLTANKKLLLFPAATLICTLLIDLLSGGNEWREFIQILRPASIVEVHERSPLEARRLAAQLASPLCATFFNVALYHQVLKVWGGEPVSFVAGLSFAYSRLRAIASWSIVAWAAAVASDQISGAGALGQSAAVARVVASAGALAFVATLFVIPVMVRDETANPLRLLKISLTILRQTWRRSAYGFLAIVARFLVPALVGLFVLGPLLTVPIVLLPTFMAFWAYFGFLFLIYDIYLSALYVFATEGVIPRPYAEADMDSAWQVELPRRKRSKRSTRAVASQTPDHS